MKTVDEILEFLENEIKFLSRSSSAYENIGDSKLKSHYLAMALANKKVIDFIKEGEDEN